jgi:DNA-nicking Smr family endonuclease
MTKHKNSNTDLTAEESALFQAQVKGIKPLKSETPLKKPRKPLRLRPKAPPSSHPDLPVAIREPQGALDELEFYRTGVCRRQLKAWALQPVEATLDLHGLTVSAAKEALLAFMERATRQGKRRLRIIHGKGRRSNTKTALLKSYVHTWLPEFPQVLGYRSCPTHQGGSGALIVILKSL